MYEVVSRAERALGSGGPSADTPRTVAEPGASVQVMHVAVNLVSGDPDDD